MKRSFCGIMAAVLCTAMLAGCSQNSTDTPVSDTTTAASEATTAAVDENAVDPSAPVNLEEGVTDKMYNRAIMNEGNLTRLAAAMKKAQNGEKVTVGVIGGSITQGSLASNSENCYASKFFGWRS